MKGGGGGSGIASAGFVPSFGGSGSAKKGTTQGRIDEWIKDREYSSFSDDISRFWENQKWSVMSSERMELDLPSAAWSLYKVEGASDHRFRRKAWVQAGTSRRSSRLRRCGGCSRRNGVFPAISRDAKAARGAGENDGVRAWSARPGGHGAAGRFRGSRGARPYRMLSGAGNSSKISASVCKGSRRAISPCGRQWRVWVALWATWWAAR